MLAKTSRLVFRCALVVLLLASSACSGTGGPASAGGRDTRVNSDGAADGGPSVAVTIAATTDVDAGTNGRLDEFMATIFQPADWSYTFFPDHPDTSPLEALGAQHIRLDVVDGAMPWLANSSPPQATDWDFSKLDAIVQPVLSVGDHSPLLQLGTAPNLPGLVDGSGNFVVTGANLAALAQYYANVVRYYNKGGFDWGGAHFQSPSAASITWWSIFNEYNINGLSPSDYVAIYDAVVPAMLAVDPSIKLSAIELASYDYQVGDPHNNLPTILAAPAAGGIASRADVLSMHLFGACNQTDTDAFSKVSAFAGDLRYFYAEAAARPDLGALPVWVTANNVDPDSAGPDGHSICNPSQAYVPDPRGTSAFFAAWGPYVFSVLGKAGARALYHWQYSSGSPFNPQYDEFNGDTNTPTLAYWVDQTLGRLFPSVPGAPGPSILRTTVSDPSAVEVLATKADDGVVTVLVVDRAVGAPQDDNGAGAPRTVTLDVSALGPFKSATRLSLDATTDVTMQPTAVPVSPASPVVVSFGGYGVAFLVMSP